MKLYLNLFSGEKYECMNLHIYSSKKEYIINTLEYLAHFV